MNDLTQDAKDTIFERANSRDLYILRRTPDKKENVFPAKIYGRLLDYPHISAINKPEIEAEINWSQVNRMADGYLNYIEI